MKNNRFGFFVILAFAALASSCGTSGYYASSVYDDGIYYRPTAESRAKIVAAQEAQREKERQRQYDQYLAKDEDGHLYVVTELMDGETYESRLHKFDSPWYTNYAWYGYWDSPWYNPWWGSWRYSYYNRAFWGSPWYYSSWYGYYDPYYYYSWDPWYWGTGMYAGWYGWYGWDRWHHHYYYPSYGYYGPGPGPRDHYRNVVYTPRNAATGSGMYRTTGAGTVNGNRGMYTTRRTSSGGSVSTRTSTGTVRSSGTSRPTRTGSSGGGYTRSSGSYSSGGYSGRSSSSSGGGFSGGSSSSGGGRSVSGGTHSGGGRR